ncbi:hypothetical protein C900_03914 [Fulvivirga imtechensis AK7]|uniref:Uncharacterized protein n=1 Tax=Fulvivirga imtechensis AK7 TaxID=1237149 RepID=L8JRY6_9BACT|nr:hypothetical protein [Fulvivirga imtechensis]ELR70229.1 hypothetical protein C900_03914 [Fulvivirga imtechensis AK7]
MNIRENKKKAKPKLCPVCWGYQEYDRKIRIRIKDKQVDVNNHLGYHTRIRKFLVRHVDGIHLQQGTLQNCPTCLERI